MAPGAATAPSPKCSSSTSRHDLEIRFLFGNVRDDVMAATGRVQEPHVYSNLGGSKLYLNR
jgi:hypothetical protein